MKCIYSSVYGWNFSGDVEDGALNVFRIIKSRARDYYYLDADGVLLELLTEAELKGQIPPDSAKSRESP